MIHKCNKMQNGLDLLAIISQNRKLGQICENEVGEHACEKMICIVRVVRAVLQGIMCVLRI